MYVYSYEVKIENNNPVVYIYSTQDNEGPYIQPHHPSAPNLSPWGSVEEAEAWGVEAVKEFENIQQQKIIVTPIIEQPKE